MPDSVAKLTATVVTWIVVFGTDGDVLRAVPLGLFAGILAATLVAFADNWQPASIRR
jgi:hypothetical protein